MFYLLSILFMFASLFWADDTLTGLISIGCAGFGGVFMATAVYEPRIKAALKAGSSAARTDVEAR